MAELTERDRGLLQNKIEDIESENEQLRGSIDSDTTDVNSLTLFDIPFKKNLDEKHYNIYAFEEELRLLTGKTIIGPVEEDAFWVTAPDEGDIFILIKDGRFIAKKNDIVIVDIPIIPSRGSVVSGEAGTDFDLWTRDRFGSTTSETGVPQSYTIHEGNNKIKIKINGTIYELQIASNEILEASNDVYTADPYILASFIVAAFELTDASGVQCIYNPSRQTFTVVSNTSGPGSTAEVIVETTDPDDIAYLMKFSNQTMLSGKYANNKLNVKIDDEEKQIEIIFDIRQAEYSQYLGYNIDDYGADWRWDFSDGPLFPASSNNGRKIAALIQNKLNEESSDGFKFAECLYYSDSQKFVIYSGTFGEESSVEILHASDRDMAPTIGMDNISFQRGNETSYTTLGNLYDYLNNETSLECTRLSNSSKSCYSLLSLLNPIAVSEQQCIMQTTSEYDDAHFGLPRLYGNKTRVDDSNNKFDIVADGVPSITIPHGEYSEYGLAEALQDVLNDNSSYEFEVVYKQNIKKFRISCDNTVTLLFNTGANKYRSIATYMGFPNFSDETGDFFESEEITYSGADFFTLTEIPQLVPFSYFNDEPPYYYDFQFGERHWLRIIEILVNAENNTGTDALDLLKNQTDFNNEAYLDYWEQMAIVTELDIETSQYETLRQEIVFYSRISTSDTTYNNKVTALNNSIANRNDLLRFVDHASIMNIRESSSTFSEGPNPLFEFDEASFDQLRVIIATPNNDKIYNRPAPEAKYADDKFLPMRSIILGNTALYDSAVDFEPFEALGFTIQSIATGVPGHAASGTGGPLYIIDQPADSNATLLSTNDEYYDLSSADQMIVSVDGTPNQTVQIDANSAYIDSTDILSDGVFVIRPSLNDKIDYNDGVAHTVTISSGIYKGSALRTEIESRLQAESPGTGFTVSWSSNQFTINALFSVNYLFNSGPNASQSIGKMIGFPIDISGSSVVSTTRNIYVQQNINDDFAATINAAPTGTLLISESNYSIAALVTEIENTINAAISSAVIVTEVSSKIRISTQFRGTGATITVITGVNDFLKSIYMNTAVAVSGSGDVFDINAVTANEIRDKINSDVVGLSSNVEGTKVRVTTDSVNGTLSRINFTTNAFATTVGFLSSSIGIDQNNKLNVSVDGVEAVIELNTNPSSVTGTVIASDIQTKLRAVGGGGFNDSFAFYNPTDYPDSFKIISGSFGPTSTALINEKTIVIDTSSNKIDFEETGGSELTATIPSGLYDSSSIATAIKNAMEAVGASTYTVTGSSILTISSNGVGGAGIFNLLFSTGSNASSSIATNIGFFKNDLTTSLSYLGNSTIKLGSAFYTLDWDIQTNVAGHDIDDTRLEITNTYIASTIYWSSTSEEDFKYLFSNYTDIKSLIDVITTEHPKYNITVDAELWSRYFETYRIFNNDQFKITPGSSAQQIVTFICTRGQSISSSNPDRVALSGDTLSLSVNGESTKTITMPTGTMNGPHTAELIQILIRTLQANNVVNQPAYTNFICYYDSGLYYLQSGTEGTGSSVNVTGGTLSAKLKLGSNETIGTGDVANNYFATANELITKIVLTDITVSNVHDYLKFASVDEKIEIESNDLSNRLGFFDENLVSDPDVDLANTRSASLVRVSNVPIHLHLSFTAIVNPLADTINVTGAGYLMQTGDIFYDQHDNLFYVIGISLTQIQAATSLENAFLGIPYDWPGSIPFSFPLTPDPNPYRAIRGYEGSRGDITITYSVTDDSLIDSRRPEAATRAGNIAVRLSQIDAREIVINSELSPAVYEDRWEEVVKRINKTNGSYFKVGEKELGIIRSQNTISENEDKIDEINNMLGV